MNTYKPHYTSLGAGVYARQDQFFIQIKPPPFPRYFPITEREAAQKLRLKHDPRKFAQILADAQQRPPGEAMIVAAA